MVDYLIVGLGNPGSKYNQTRHNIGFWLIDSIAESKGLNFKYQKVFHAHYSLMSHNNSKFALVKPTTFMNESGRYLKTILAYFKCPQQKIIIVHDDITLALGSLKVSQNKGTGGHNGVGSIVSYLGNTFIRLRIGIGAKTTRSTNLADYVLSKFSKEDLNVLESQKPFIIDALFSIFDNGVEYTMNHFNKQYSS